MEDVESHEERGDRLSIGAPDKYVAIHEVFVDMGGQLPMVFLEERQILAILRRGEGDSYLHELACGKVVDVGAVVDRPDTVVLHKGTVAHDLRIPDP